ncbi:hypothetical protein [Sulfurirhabdus autotrophica]|uniref:Glycosyl hydrolase family 57 n=1 Tax=Sulfurirhabdus autotrophica TaxID=1706046 RepID=A0A4R3Y8G5_9PROT|nr:hypothetical protein [Sulfurirhabdus autotrophica]TCV88140.1 glycosyl hydrolase family 57 [Sulfurirhabdus autotrophica]
MGTITILIIVAWFTGIGLLLGIIYRKGLIALWREPVLRHPVLIFESDDWGAGPLQQADALNALHAVLSRFKDCRGHHPVMTLGLVLSIPDTQRINKSVPLAYHELVLSEPVFIPILNAIKQGMESGTFSAQLHGMAHYWPPALIASAEHNVEIRNWLSHQEYASTETLPDHLQSRWTDGSVLPTQPIDDAAIERAITEEVKVFQDILGVAPVVAVPPTFVWNDTVERIWSKLGVQTVITPGTRYEFRDAQGKLSPTGIKILNGERSAKTLYLVRDEYFEPARGHRAADTLMKMVKKSALGRPTLLETHRFNFINDKNTCNNALKELEILLKAVLQRFPDVRFISTATLSAQIAAHQGSLINTSFLHQLNAWLLRIKEISGFWKLARISGFALPLWLISLAVSQSKHNASHSAMNTP